MTPFLTSGLSGPVGVYDPADGSGRLFVVEQVGRIQIWDGAQILPTPFLDLATKVDSSFNEQGLLGFAFAPAFATSGLFFVSYTTDPPGPGLDLSVIERYALSGNPNVADPASAFTVLETAQDFSNHNGGDIHFGPDGYLYLGLGDGGSAGDPNNRAQDRANLLGSMVRLDVSILPVRGAERGVSGEICALTANYSIPPDNPYAGADGFCDEIWAFGLRNPWRFSFDRFTGDLYIGDVGQNAREEIDRQSAASPGGENYGWDCFEGTEVYTGSNSGTTTCQAAPVEPILDYAQAGVHCAVSGGYRYRGPSMAGLGYLYADYCSTRLWTASEKSGVWSNDAELVTGVKITGFAELADGEILVISRDADTIYRLTSPSSIFADGFESGDPQIWTAVIP